MRDERVRRAAEATTAHATSPRKEILRGALTRVNECHSFAWSRKLWAAASKNILRVVMVFTLVHVGIMGAGVYADGLRGIDIPYFLACTLTTVGFGDISPKTQWLRCIFIFMLPYGIILISTKHFFNASLGKRGSAMRAQF